MAALHSLPACPSGNTKYINYLTHAIGVFPVGIHFVSELVDNIQDMNIMKGYAEEMNTIQMFIDFTAGECLRR